MLCGESEWEWMLYGEIYVDGCGDAAEMDVTIKEKRFFTNKSNVFSKIIFQR